MAHGLIHRQVLAYDDERAMIDKCLDDIEAFTGVRPRGWFGPGLAQTFDTPDHLAVAGVDYAMDWMFDDLPCWMGTKHGPLLYIPYTLELSDVWFTRSKSWMGPTSCGALRPFSRLLIGNSTISLAS